TTIETFRALRVKRCFFLQTGNQIRVSNIVTAERHRVDQAFANQVFGFFWGISARTDDHAVEALAHFLTEGFSVWLTTGPVRFGHMQVGNTTFCQLFDQIQRVSFFVRAVVDVLERPNWRYADTDAFRAPLLAYGVYHFQHQAGTVFNAAAVLIGTMVRRR